jgi:hypothetical protein
VEIGDKTLAVASKRVWKIVENDLPNGQKELRAV